MTFRWKIARTLCFRRRTKICAKAEKKTAKNATAPRDAHMSGDGAVIGISEERMRPRQDGKIRAAARENAGIIRVSGRWASEAEALSNFSAEKARFASGFGKARRRYFCGRGTGNSAAPVARRAESHADKGLFEASTPKNDAARVAGPQFIRKEGNRKGAPSQKTPEAPAADAPHELSDSLPAARPRQTGRTVR